MIGEVAGKIEGNCRYKSNAHYKAARRWSRMHYLLGVSAVILAAITGFFSFAQPFPNKDIVVGILATVVAALSALITFLIPNDKAAVHHTAAIKYDALKERARSLGGIEVSFPTIPTEELYERLEELRETVVATDTASPLTYGLTARDFRRIKRLRDYIYEYVEKQRHKAKRRRSKRKK